MATQTKPKNKVKTRARKAPKKSSNGHVVPQKAPAIRAKNIAALKMLREWDNFTPEEIEEQKETWAFLKKALDEDRLSPNRPLFPSDDEDNST